MKKLLLMFFCVGFFTAMSGNAESLPAKSLGPVATMPPPFPMPPQPIQVDCSFVCGSLSGWAWLQCMAGCQTYNLISFSGLPASLKENPFFLTPCQRDRMERTRQTSTEAD